MNSNPSHKNRAFTLAASANVLWATSFLGSKYTLTAWGPFTASFLRFLLAGAAMAALFSFIGVGVRLPDRKEFKAISLIGLVQFGVLYPLQLYGLQHISTSLSAAIMLMSPLMVVGLAGAYLGERVGTQKVLAICVGIFGGLVLLHDELQTSGHYFWGVVLTVGAAFALALSMVLTRKHAPHIPTPHLSLWSMVVGSFLLSPFVMVEMAVSESLYFSWGNYQNAVIALVYLAIVCSGFTFYIWNRALSLTPAKNIASTMHLKTPVAIFLGCVVAGEKISSEMILGSSIIFAGLWLSQKEWSRPKSVQTIADKETSYANS